MERSTRQQTQRRCATFLALCALAGASSCGEPPAGGGSTSPDGIGGASGEDPMAGAGNATAAGGAGAGVTPSESLGGAGSLTPAGAGASGGGNAAGGGAVPPPVNTTSPSDGRPVCARYPARSDGLLIDFDTYDPLDGSWGDASLGQLTGGTSGYSCADDGVSCPASAIIARVRTGGGGLRIQAAVPALGYTGMVLWFGPCVDASAFGGLQFQVSGELFGAVLSVKLQTHDNYPIDLVNVKGGCSYTSEADKWSECVPPEFEIATSAAEPATVSIAWSDFGNGIPNAGVSPEGLVGVELAFECPSDVDCAMDLRLGELRWLP
jgi:hypothetical protein